MKNILVIDVAAEKGGALSVLNEYIEKFSKDSDNNYYFVLSKVSREDVNNIHFIQLPWVKRTHLHRMYFDLLYIRRLISKYNIDELYSLQNNAFLIKTIPQTVLLHNALFFTERRFSFVESKRIWLYQNIISNYVKLSLINADTIVVQANWIKSLLVEKWGLNKSKVVVCKPNIQIPNIQKEVSLPKNTLLFYPANGALYKNHIILLRAFNKLNSSYYSLVFTGTIDNLNMECRNYIIQNGLNVYFLGHLSKEEIYYVYQNSILVFPSLVETVGLPLLEVRQIGGIIIVSDLPYAKEALENYGRVTYFDPSSDVDLVNSITQLL